MASSDIVVSVENLSKRFRLYHARNQSLKQSLLSRQRSEHQDFWALQDVSFEVTAGETFGVIGHNGSGKSTMLKCLTGILQPDKGNVDVRGQVSALLELGAGFHPELSGRENVFLNAAILGVPRRHIQARFDDIVAFAGLERFIDTPVKNYSSGMFVRLGFAVAVNVEPDILIIDEVLSVGDAEFQARCGDKIAEFRASGRTILLVTHSMSDVERICDRVVWLDHGQRRAIGDPAAVADEYLSTTHSGRGVTMHDGKRWGAGDVTIEAAQFIDHSGAPVEFPQSGERYVLQIALHAPQPVTSPEVGFSIYDRDGTLITQVSTATRGIDLGEVHGQAAVSFAIDSLPLNEGTYEMSFMALDSTGQREFDIRSRLLTFDVMRGATRDGGLVAINGDWSATPAAL